MLKATVLLKTKYAFHALLSLLEPERIRVANSLVSYTEGRRSFFVQWPIAGAGRFNRDSSPLTRRDEDGVIAESPS